jgi:hypothetical protein
MSNIHFCGHKGNSGDNIEREHFLCWDCTIKFYINKKEINDIVTILYDLKNFKVEGFSTKQLSYAHFIRSKWLAQLFLYKDIQPNITKIIVQNDPQYFLDRKNLYLCEVLEEYKQTNEPVKNISPVFKLYKEPDTGKL